MTIPPGTLWLNVGRFGVNARSFKAALLCTLAMVASLRADQPYGLQSRPAGGAFLDGRMPELGPGISGNWSAVVAFPNLEFKNALGVLPVPGSQKLAVWEREGRVWMFDDRPDASSKKLALDLSLQCQGWDDSGLLNIAFHPDFAHNHYLFAWYTWVVPGSVTGNPNQRPDTGRPNRNHLSRFTLDDHGVAIAGSEVVLIDQECHVVWHKGGGMFFHPTSGFLHVTVGDDEDGSNAQRIDHNLFGGIFRIDVDERGGNISHPIRKQPDNGHTARYFIPNDNPFVGQPNALEEFYGLGLRSPHRMTYDAPSGRTFIGDVGDSAREEIDIIEPTDPPGLNFQWPVIEGLRGDLIAPFIGVNKRPVIDYDHGEGNAVIGGMVYRGKQWADDLNGRYIFGDNGAGKIWALDERTNPPTKLQLCLLPFGPGPNSGSNYTGLSSFGVDHEGELYMCQMSSMAGHLYRLQRQGPPAARKPFPRLLSQTGAFSDTARLIPAPSLIPYAVNAPLWSDGAVKSRWMMLPAGAKIKYADKGEWQFPAGTVFVKHFEMPTDEARRQVRRRLETRLLVLDASGSAYGVTYKWRADNSDAELLDGSLNEPLAIKNAAGQTRAQNWYYPSQNDCIRCHTPAAGYVLGPKTRQLNGQFLYESSGVKDNQLRAWNHLGLLDPPLQENAIATLDRDAPIDDAAATLEQRARSYLDANCAQCHRPGGVHALWDARIDTPLMGAAIVNGAAITRIGPAGSRILRPGDVEHSLLYRRITATEPLLMMPPLARNTVDRTAAAVIERWISQMPPLGALPKQWIAQDIGVVGAGGDATFSDGVFSVSGSGDDIWSASDAFHFVHRPLHGDGAIVARVLSMSQGDGWAKVGVMIRQSDSPSAAHAMTVLTNSNGAAFQRRLEPGGDSDTSGRGGLTAPYWVKLERRGDQILSSASPDGQTWTLLDQATLPLPPDALIGLCVTSHNNNALEIATFDHVEVR